MPELKPVAPADPDAGMIREGSKDGPASVRFDPVKRAAYHLTLRGERVYHGVPGGYEFNDAGELHALKSTPEGYSAPVPVDPHAGLPVEVKEN